MPNDAKLGLLVGVVGVIVVAVISSNRQPSPQTAIAVPQQTAMPTAPEKNQSKPAVDGKPTVPPPRDADVVPAVPPVELASTPVTRTKREPNAQATSRPRTDDDLDP